MTKSHMRLPRTNTAYHKMVQFLPHSTHTSQTARITKTVSAFEFMRLALQMLDRGDVFLGFFVFLMLLHRSLVVVV